MNQADSTEAVRHTWILLTPDQPNRNGRVYPPEVMQRAVQDHIRSWQQRALETDSVSIGSRPARSWGTHRIDSIEVVGDTMHVNMTLMPIEVQYKMAVKEIQESLDNRPQPAKTRYQLLLEKDSTDAKGALGL